MGNINSEPRAELGSSPLRRSAGCHAFQRVESDHPTPSLFLFPPLERTTSRRASHPIWRCHSHRSNNHDTQHPDHHRGKRRRDRPRNRSRHLNPAPQQPQNRRRREERCTNACADNRVHLSIRLVRSHHACVHDDRHNPRRDDPDRHRSAPSECGVPHVSTLARPALNIGCPVGW